MSEELTENPTSQPKASERIVGWEWTLLFIVVAVGGLLRLDEPGLSYFNLHVGRDLYRAMQLLRLDEIPLLGSEMQYGGRVFGPLIYFLYAIPLAIWESPISVGLFIGVTNLVLLVWTWWFVRRYFGPIAAITAAGFYATFPLEIVQLRFLWNPTFLPFMMVGMYHCLYLYSVKQKQWALLGVTFFFAMGFQLHFSVLMAIPVILAAMGSLWKRIDYKVIAASFLLLLVLFTPFFIHELKPNSRAVVKDVIAVEHAKPSVLERHKPNPRAWRNLVHVVSLDWNEDPYGLGFTYLNFLRTHAEEEFGTFAYFLLNLIRVGGLFQLFLWGTGIFVAGKVVNDHRVMRSSLAGDALDDHRTQALKYGLLLGWQFVPILFLSFFNYHTAMAGADSAYALIPLRYYLVTYPAQFILAGVGLQFLLLREESNRVALWGIPTGLVIMGYSFFSIAHLALVNQSGKVLDYTQFRVPNLKVMEAVKEQLLGDFKITADDYYERVYTQNVFQPLVGESTLDWLITQDARAYTNEGLADDHFIFIHAPKLDANPGDAFDQALFQGNATMVRFDEVSDIHLFEIEGLPPEDSETFDPTTKRNYYYREVRMKYLGREGID